MPWHRYATLNSVAIPSLFDLDDILPHTPLASIKTLVVTECHRLVVPYVSYLLACPRFEKLVDRHQSRTWSRADLQEFLKEG